MTTLNRVTLIGYPGADPETRHLPGGDAVTTIRLATTDRYRDKASGEMRESTGWHRVAFFGRFSDIAAGFLKQGAGVYIEGRIKTRKWQDEAGQDRYATEIVASSLQLLDRAGTRSADSAAQSYGSGSVQGAEEDDNDNPF